MTKARYGSRARSRLTAIGAWASKRLLVRTAPALVVASAFANFAVSTNVRSPGPARSIGAILVIRCDSAVPSRGTAPVNDAISARVSDFALPVDIIRLPRVTRSARRTGTTLATYSTSRMGNESGTQNLLQHFGAWPSVAEEG